MEAHQAMAVRVEQQRWVRSSRRRPSEKAEVIFRTIDTLARTLFYLCILLFRTFDLLSRTQSSRGPVLPFLSAVSPRRTSHPKPKRLPLYSHSHSHSCTSTYQRNIHRVVCIHVSMFIPRGPIPPPWIFRKILFACLWMVSRQVWRNI